MKRPYRHYSDEDLFQLAEMLETDSEQSAFIIEQLTLVEAEIAEREWNYS